MSVINSATAFKPNSFALTESRIGKVLTYITYCYAKMVNEKKQYNYIDRGKIAKEDFLRNGLVDDYLSQKVNKDYYRTHLADSPTVEIYFNKEENNVYRDNISGQTADDFIDISIKETKLSEILSVDTGDEVKFAVECKRIDSTTDYSEYIDDVKKFSDREFKTYRLPYEGQIAFIENKNLSHTIVSKEINKRLSENKSIITVQYLTKHTLNNGFEASYHSKHNRNYGQKSPFSIYHLLLDYSSIIVN